MVANFFEHQSDAVWAIRVNKRPPVPSCVRASLRKLIVSMIHPKSNIAFADIEVKQEQTEETGSGRRSTTPNLETSQ